jgi:DNA polymerase elongation subunit (family B)
MDLTKLSEKELRELKRKLEYDISEYDNFQLVKKIQLNSAYGAIGNEYFRYYSTEIAEAITLSGQLSIQFIGNELNKFLNKTLETQDVDYVIASDTDSVYLKMEEFVNKFVPKTKTTEDIVDLLDKAADTVILPFIKKKFDELSIKMNAYENKMYMGREVIANKGIWTAKKRYMLNVWDKEGIRLTKPELKIMCIETTRSSTPEVVRNDLQQAIDIILNKDQEFLISFIDDVRAKFYKYSPEKIAFPRSVNGMDKYRDSYNIYQKSTPIAVKGALIYNHYVKKAGLEMKYKLIGDGEKIKFLYLKKPNPLGGMRGEDQVISFTNELPKEFGLDGYIDYSLQFQKSFLDPLDTILKVIGWSHEKKNTLESLFS